MPFEEVGAVATAFLQYWKIWHNSPTLRSIVAANDGLQCLDDLCSQSRFIEEDIKKQAKTPEIEHNDQLKLDNKQQQEVGVRRLFSDFSYPMYGHT